MITIEKLKDTVKELFAADENISLAYIFGSAVTGKMHPDSDIDVGILLGSCGDRHECAEASLSLSARLAKALGTDRVDLIILNFADPLVAFEVVSKGVLAYERQPGLSDNYRLKAIKMYMDAKKFFELDKQTIKKFLSEMKPGA